MTTNEEPLDQILRQTIYRFEILQDLSAANEGDSEAESLTIWLEDFTTALISWTIDVRMDFGSLALVEHRAVGRRIRETIVFCRSEVEQIVDLARRDGYVSKNC